jgi:hypothetical protein
MVVKQHIRYVIALLRFQNSKTRNVFPINVTKNEKQNQNTPSEQLKYSNSHFNPQKSDVVKLA